MSNNHQGVNTTSKGVMNIKSQTTPVANTGNKKAGMAFDANDNLLTVDATAAMPAGTVLIDGIAYTSDGRMCISTAVPALTGTKTRGMAIRADGALHIVTGALTAPTRHLGRAYDAFGRLQVISN